MPQEGNSPPVATSPVASENATSPSAALRTDAKSLLRAADSALSDDISAILQKLLRESNSYAPFALVDLTAETKLILGEAWKLAGLLRHREVIVEHLIVALLNSNAGEKLPKTKDEDLLVLQTGALVRATSFDGGRLAGASDPPDLVEGPLANWIGEAATRAIKRGDGHITADDLIAVYHDIIDTDPKPHRNLSERFQLVRSLGQTSSHLEKVRQRVWTTHDAVKALDRDASKSFDVLAGRLDTLSDELQHIASWASSRETQDVQSRQELTTTLAGIAASSSAGFADQARQTRAQVTGLETKVSEISTVHVPSLKAALAELRELLVSVAHSRSSPDSAHLNFSEVTGKLRDNGVRLAAVDDRTKAIADALPTPPALRKVAFAATCVLALGVAAGLILSKFAL